MFGVVFLSNGVQLEGLTESRSDVFVPASIFTLIFCLIKKYLR